MESEWNDDHSAESDMLKDDHYLQYLLFSRYVLGWRMDCEATAQASFLNHRDPQYVDLHDHQ